MRPPKPRIAKPRLVWKWRQAKGVWEPYHRTTYTENGRERQRLIKLDWKADPAELDRLFWQCEAGRHQRQAPAPSGRTWADLVVIWKSDPRVKARLAASSRADYIKTMETDILPKNSHKDVAKTTRAALRAKHDRLSATPRRADKFLQVVSLLWNYAQKKLDWPLGQNPASGIDHFGKQRAFEPWPEWMIEKLAEAPARVRLAAELILGTGQRPNAAITMRRDAFRGDYVAVRDEKGGATFEIYCPERLRKIVDQYPFEGAHVLARNLSEPLGYDNVEKAFRAWRESLGERARPYSLHGLRKSAIIALAEAGASDAEIQAVTNQSAEMVAYYRQNANRRRLSRAAIQRASHPGTEQE